MSCHCLLGYEFQRAGQLRYKCMLNPERWQQAFFILQKAHLFICPAEEDGAEDSINLRRLQELSECPGWVHGAWLCHPLSPLLLSPTQVWCPPQIRQRRGRCCCWWRWGGESWMWDGWGGC